MRGRIYVTEALVLSNFKTREADRGAVLYTRELGKVRARFIGVNRPQGKLKALSEPMALGEYRLYLRDGAESGVAAGGMLETAYPALRSSLKRLLCGLEVVELLDRLTPFWKPNPEKLDLAVSCLAQLEKSAGGDWIVGACALRLLEAAGYGQGERKVSRENSLLWEVLHNAGIEEVAALPPDPALQARLSLFVRRTVERVTEKPLNTAAMRDSLIGVAA